MIMTLTEVAEHAQAEKPPKELRDILAAARRIFGYGEERNNRIARFVAIVHSYSNKVSVADIEDQYGCSRQTVLRYARMADLPKRPKHFPAAIRAAVIRDYKAKIPIAAIATTHNVSPAYVSRVAKQEQISRYRPDGDLKPETVARNRRHDRRASRTGPGAP